MQTYLHKVTGIVIMFLAIDIPLQGIHQVLPK